MNCVRWQRGITSPAPCSSTHSRCFRYSQPFRSQAACRRHTLVQAYRFKCPDGTELSVDKARYIVGSVAEADVVLTDANVAAEHAELQQKGKQVFLKALQGESVFDRTYTWIDGVEARPNVSYVLASGSCIAFGEKQQSYVIDFEEPSGANPLVELMMKGMVVSADAEVQQELLQ